MKDTSTAPDSTGVGGEAGVRKEHKFERQIELVCQRVGDVRSDALRLTIRILHDEEDRLLGGKYQRDAQLAGECKFFHGLSLAWASAASSVVNNNNSTMGVHKSGPLKRRLVPLAGSIDKLSWQGAIFLSSRPCTSELRRRCLLRVISTQAPPPGCIRRRARRACSRWCLPRRCRSWRAPARKYARLRRDRIRPDCRRRAAWL